MSPAENYTPERFKLADRMFADLHNQLEELEVLIEHVADWLTAYAAHTSSLLTVAEAQAEAERIFGAVANAQVGGSGQ